MVSALVDLLIADPKAPDEALTVKLAQNGVEDTFVPELLSLVPMAFARYFLRNAPFIFGDYMFLINERTRETLELKRLDNPIYAAAYRAAEHCAKVLSQTQMMFICARNEGYNSIAAALQKGWRREDIVVMDPVVIVPEDRWNREQERAAAKRQQT